MSSVADTEEEEAGGAGFLSHLPVILWQRKLLILVPLVLFSIAGVAAALLIPPTYRSSALLLVESQQLPKELVGASFNNVIDKRIAKVRQQILSRPDLVELIQSNNLYPNERQAQPLSAVIEKMRESTSISPVNADIAPDQSGSTTIAFALSFEYPEAQKAQLVAQSFVDRLVKIDSTQLAEQAASTVDYLEEQSQTLTTQISDLEQQIEGIKAANGMALSSSGAIMMGGSGGYEAQIAALQRENAQLAQQLSLIPSASQRDPMVVAAEGALAAAKAQYSDSHPDVRLAEQRLAEARRLASRSALPGNASATIRAQIASNNSTIAALNQARATEQSRQSSVLAAQASAPLVTEQIAQLEARADGLRESYQEVSTNLMNARTAVRMSAEQKGEHLSVTDPPVVPDEPSWPNRPLLAAGGLLLGAGLGLALALLIEIVRQPIRGVQAVQRLTGAAPLVVIPTLRAGAPRPARRDKADRSSAKRRAGRNASRKAGTRKQARGA